MRETSEQAEVLHPGIETGEGKRDRLVPPRGSGGVLGRLLARWAAERGSIRRLSNFSHSAWLSSPAASTIVSRQRSFWTF
jgi:hypothetical protein